MELIDEREEINLPEWDSESPLVVLTQTTLSVLDTSKAVDEVKNSFPELAGEE